MKTTLSILAALAALGALWLQIGALALLVAPVIALFVLMAFTPLAVEKLELQTGARGGEQNLTHVTGPGLK